MEKPVRYMGNEFNMVVKEKSNVDIRFAFAFPDVYEVGMSHLGLKLMYHKINERSDSYCERVFAPWIDMEKKMREKNIPLFSLETKDPVNKFDLIGFTLQYEMTYTNIINMLDLAQIPIYSSERNENDPIIIAGGPCAYNPEPLADFVDLIVLGDGEEVIDEILDLYKNKKINGVTRQDFLRSATKIEGVYVPQFYKPSYNDDGTISEITPISQEFPSKITKRVVYSLDDSYFPSKMIVPFMDIVHDRIALEIFRGCSRGCRFCQAGFIYRPVRERSAETLLQKAGELIQTTGYEEISLVSLSTSDYSKFNELLPGLSKLIKENNVSLSLPSMRIDSFPNGFQEDTEVFKKTGVTLAPEAGSQRLRDVINKGVSNQDLINSVKSALERGLNTIKLYFMIGLPTEEQPDIDGIVEMVRLIKDNRDPSLRGLKTGDLKINISVSTFVPKPFTPFQWVAQDTVESLKNKLYSLTKRLKLRGVQFNWHDPNQSYIEALLARGDRRLSNLLVRVWEKGSKFEGWSEHFILDNWLESCEELGIAPEFYINRVRNNNEIFPWEHIDIGVSKEFLLREYELSAESTTTPDCKTQCSLCGIQNIAKGVC